MEFKQQLAKQIYCLYTKLNMHLSAVTCYILVKHCIVNRDLGLGEVLYLQGVLQHPLASIR